MLFVELFTPLRSIDLVSVMYQVTRSTRRLRRNVAVIPHTDIISPCHLIPKNTSNHWERSWNTDTVLDLAPHFLVNSYSLVRQFSTFRLACNTS